MTETVEAMFKKRPRRRSTASILKAAKAAGCVAVEFPDGTTVKITAEASLNGVADTEVERWFRDHAN